MQNINSQASIRVAIAQLEIQQAEEAKMLKEQFQLIYDAMQPINLIKSTLKEVVDSQQVKQDLLNATVGAATSYASKLLFADRTKDPMKKILGGATLLGITNLITENPETVKSVATGFFKIIRNLSNSIAAKAPGKKERGVEK